MNRPGIPPVTPVTPVTAVTPVPVAKRADPVPRSPDINQPSPGATKEKGHWVTLHGHKVYISDDGKLHFGGPDTPGVSPKDPGFHAKVAHSLASAPTHRDHDPDGTGGVGPFLTVQRDAQTHSVHHTALSREGSTAVIRQDAVAQGADPGQGPRTVEVGGMYSPDHQMLWERDPLAADTDTSAQSHPKALELARRFIVARHASKLAQYAAHHLATVRAGPLAGSGIMAGIRRGVAAAGRHFGLTNRGARQTNHSTGDWVRWYRRSRAAQAARTGTPDADPQAGKPPDSPWSSGMGRPPSLKLVDGRTWPTHLSPDSIPEAPSHDAIAQGTHVPEGWSEHPGDALPATPGKRPVGLRDNGVPLPAGRSISELRNPVTGMTVSTFFSSRPNGMSPTGGGSAEEWGNLSSVVSRNGASLTRVNAVGTVSDARRVSGRLAGWVDTQMAADTPPPSSTAPDARRSGDAGAPRPGGEPAGSLADRHVGIDQELAPPPDGSVLAPDPSLPSTPYVPSPKWPRQIDADAVSDQPAYLPAQSRYDGVNTTVDGADPRQTFRVDGRPLAPGMGIVEYRNSRTGIRTTGHFTRAPEGAVHGDGSAHGPFQVTVTGRDGQLSTTLHGNGSARQVWGEAAQVHNWANEYRGQWPDDAPARNPDGSEESGLPPAPPHDPWWENALGGGGADWSPPGETEQEWAVRMAEQARIQHEQQVAASVALAEGRAKMEESLKDQDADPDADTDRPDVFSADDAELLRARDPITAALCNNQFTVNFLDPADARLQGVSPGLRARHRRFVEHHIFGRSIHPREYGEMVGALDGSMVTVSMSGDPSNPDASTVNISTNLQGPNGYSSSRTIFWKSLTGLNAAANGLFPDYVATDSQSGTSDPSAPKGQWTCYNAFFRNNDTSAQGNGARVLARQIRKLQQIGIGMLSVTAAGNHATAQRGGFVGYTVWPKLGYDARLHKLDIDMLRQWAIQNPDPLYPEPAGLDQMTTLSELHASKEGRGFWYRWGGERSLVFDTRPGSAQVDKQAGYLKTAKNGTRNLLGHKVGISLGPLPTSPNPLLPGRTGT